MIFLMLVALPLHGQVATKSGEVRELAADAKSWATSVVGIGLTGSRNSRMATGVVIRSDPYNGYVITTAGLPSGVSKVAVTLPTTGAELTAQVIEQDRNLNLLLLKVNGLSVPAVKFARATPGPGDAIWSLSIPEVIDITSQQLVGIARGTVTSVQPASDAALLYHSAISGERGDGAPLLNECFELVGINNLDESGQRGLSVDAVLEFSQKHNVAVTLARSGCVSPLQQARVRAEQAGEAAEAAKQEALAAQEIAKSMAAKLAATDQRSQQLVNDAAKAQQTAETAFAAAQQAQLHAEQTRVDLEKQAASLVAETDAMVQLLENDRAAAEEKFLKALDEQRQAAADREDFLLGAFAILILLLFVAVILIQRFGLPATRAAAPTAAETPSPKPAQAEPQPKKPETIATEYTLEGPDEDGIGYMLRFTIEQAAANNGVVIGRNPADAPFVINHIDVSRQHARIKLIKGRLHVEDLGSTNSTTVNGKDIADQGPVEVRSGDQIVFGAVHMKLRGKSAKEVISK